jgi:hypothetical protein
MAQAESAEELALRKIQREPIPASAALPAFLTWYSLRAKKYLDARGFSTTLLMSRH